MSPIVRLCIFRFIFFFFLSHSLSLPIRNVCKEIQAEFFLPETPEKFAWNLQKLQSMFSNDKTKKKKTIDFDLELKLIEIKKLNWITDFAQQITIIYNVCRLHATQTTESAYMLPATTHQIRQIVWTMDDDRKV